jgi:hypothetical protein
MSATLPWESALSYNSVHYAGPAERAATGSPAFTLWYQCCPPGCGGQKPVPGQKKSTDGGCVVCLAHSADGVAWTKPRLGLYAAIDGNGDILAAANQTNIVLPSPPEQDGVPGWQQTHYGAGVVVDPWPAASSRRFKMVHCRAISREVIHALHARYISLVILYIKCTGVRDDDCAAHG